MVDPLELLDFSEYDALSYHSPSLSPAANNKPQFARPPTVMKMTTPQTSIPSTQPLSGPSHQYDQYKQQTPFVPGALASTLALSENNARMNGYPVDYMSDITPNEEPFDFNNFSHYNINTPDMDVDLDSADPSFFFPDQTIDPSRIGGRESQTLSSPTLPSHTSNVGRMYPGMHQQAAMAKAQQQRQQQLMQQHQQQQQPQQQRQHSRHRSKSSVPPDPIVEQKITQLLNSMRSKPDHDDEQENSPMFQISRPKKEDDEMDEDERLLASEEGKKLSSKERRQLRNKVSARAFRSRRKEYISQLESEIATRISENGDLRLQNRTLMEENRRLCDLTRTLLSSPSFAGFLDHLSSNPSPVHVPQRPQPPVEQRQPEPRQAPKDANPFPGQMAQHRQQIGMVMIPEQNVDLSMLSLNSDVFNYQPQVFTVLETSDVPEIDLDTLAGKPSTFVDESLSSDNEKPEAPVLESPVLPSVEKPQTPQAPAQSATSENTVANLDDDIYDDETIVSSEPIVLDTDSLTTVDIFGGIEPEKAYARYELVDASEEDVATARALRRVERLAASLKYVTARLDQWTIGL
ncbi:hypothetical protein F4779DRAFT_629262 [Xylariaceae sp. FL0662B]|nr:hypothetical protein F4779DRAFT_629262 [Xylariaceae sp. FL0662B]